MKTPVIKIIDLVFTQALRTYREMEPKEACSTIAREWPEQTAALMKNFLFNGSCTNCGAAIDLIELPREDAVASYLSSLSSCDREQS